MTRKQTRSVRQRRLEYQQQQKRRRTRLAIGIVGVLIVVAALLFVVLQQPPISAEDVELPANLEAPANANGQAWGPEDAPVVIEEYADFQCPFCGQFASGPEKQLEEAYAGTGQVRFEYNNFAFIGNESRQAAEAAKCAGEQGQFWQYHDTLFLNQNGENQGAFRNDALVAFADALGLDVSAFEDCLSSNRFANDVQAETNAGRAQGVQSTPTLFVNGEKVEGAVPFSQLQARIESILAQSGGQ